MYKVDGFNLKPIDTRKYRRYAFRVKNDYINVILILDNSEIFLSNGFRLTSVRTDSVFLKFVVNNGEDEYELTATNILHEITPDNVKVHAYVHRIERLG